MTPSDKQRREQVLKLAKSLLKRARDGKVESVLIIEHDGFSVAGTAQWALAALSLTTAKFMAAYPGAIDGAKDNLERVAAAMVKKEHTH